MLNNLHFMQYIKEEFYEKPKNLVIPVSFDHGIFFISNCFKC